MRVITKFALSNRICMQRQKLSIFVHIHANKFRYFNQGAWVNSGRLSLDRILLLALVHISNQI